MKLNEWKEIKLGDKVQLTKKALRCHPEVERWMLNELFTVRQICNTVSTINPRTVLLFFDGEFPNVLQIAYWQHECIKYRRQK